MKLRLRSFETKETLKIEVPNPCNLQHLKELLSLTLPSHPLSSTIHLSLNRKDELTDSSPAESIQSMGIAPGDLLYFTTHPNGFFTDPQIVQSANPSIPKLKQAQTTQIVTTSSEREDVPLNARSSETLDLIPGKGEALGFCNPNSEETESMEIDDDGISVSEVGKSFSVPGFLRKVFTAELGDDSGLNHKLLAIAIRAVLLESGFVEFDPASNSLKSNNIDLSDSWYDSTFYYTLPDIISSRNLETGVNVINSIKIKFQNLGNYCKVYGSVVNGTSTHWVLLDEDKLVPFLNVVWANCGEIVETMEDNNTTSTVLPEKEVFEFWKKVKDRLALPLLMDLCEKVGLGLPPCFMQLPTELKLKIFESLSGVNIAMVSCVCSELRYLASSEDLWKQKYIEQFGNAEGSGEVRSYKEKFAMLWESRKRRKVVGRSSFGIMRRDRPYPRFAPRYFPGIIGGDYDLLPNLGQYNHLGQIGGGFPRLRNAVPRCNLGGLGS